METPCIGDKSSKHDITKKTDDSKTRVNARNMEYEVEKIIKNRIRNGQVITKLQNFILNLNV